MNFDRTMQGIQQAVTDAGGEWIGVQQAFDNLQDSLPQIVFRHPSTKRTILVPFNPISVDENELCETVNKVLETKTSKRDDNYVTISVAKLRTISRHLSEIQAEIDALWERKKHD